MRRARIQVVWGLGLLLFSGSLEAQARGSLEGRVTRSDSRGIGGVTVVLEGLERTEITASDGSFRFDGVPAGIYRIDFTLGKRGDVSSGVVVESGQTTTVERTVDWEVSFGEELTVFSASRRRERITEAPAAVTVISTEQIAREATHGQLAKLLEFTPGAELTQNGLFDINFNSRGFNSSQTRRMLVLIDGRDASLPFFNAMAWPHLGIPLEALDSVELVRGPGSALYGANAYQGVINLTTKAPRAGSGGYLKLSGGELSTARLGVGHAGELGAGWYARVYGDYLESDDFSRSRIDLNGDRIPQVGTEVEYQGLPLEAAPLSRDRTEVLVGNLRVDKHFTRRTLSLEAGHSVLKAGGANLSDAGRFLPTDSVFPYVRLNFNTDHFNLFAYHMRRDIDASQSLRSTRESYSELDRSQIELQGHVGFADGRGRFIAGASYREEIADTSNPEGVQTLLLKKIEPDYSSLFAQAEYDFSDRIRGVLSLRLDDSNLYESLVSPRIALIMALAAHHTLRVHFAEAFQPPSATEFFLRTVVGPPIFSLAGLEAQFCAPNGVACGLGRVSPVGLGNPDLEVEEIRSFEIGYNGIVGRKVHLSIDYYNNVQKKFLSDLVPAFNPTLGLLNPAYAPYQAPDALPADVAAELEARVLAVMPTMTNDLLTGEPLSKRLTFLNFGEVNTQGIELGVNAQLSDRWLLDAYANWIDFEIRDEIEENPLSINAPELQYGLGVTYRRQRYDASFKLRHVDGFNWRAGVFAGPVPAYEVADLTASCRFSERVEVGLNVSNLFDQVHYQIFGGDLLRRRALAHVRLSW